MSIVITEREFGSKDFSKVALIDEITVRVILARNGATLIKDYSGPAWEVMCAIATHYGQNQFEGISSVEQLAEAHEDPTVEMMVKDILDNDYFGQLTLIKL